MYGPSDTWTRLAAASSPLGGDLDDFADIFEVHPWVDGEVIRIGGLTILPRLVSHPTESFGMRITDPSGATMVYSGDTGLCESVIELATGADVFLCEASWTDSPERPKHLHLSGAEAGQVAKRAGVGRLLLTHIPPWTSREDVITEAEAEFDGPVHAVVPGETIEVRRA
jgi:ribonuclease BN (tRNA processing enzyme)